MKSLVVLSLLALGALSFVPNNTDKPVVGKPAPALRLNDQTGKIIELGGKRANWTVLAFFPKAATPG